MYLNTEKAETDKTLNYEGAEAFRLNKAMELYTLVCTCSLNDKFYETADEQFLRLEKLINQVDSDFVARLAIYAREKMYLRTVPLVLTILLAKKGGYKKLDLLTERIIQRSDELMDILLIFQVINERKKTKKLNKLPNKLKKGISAALDKFNEYNLAKYNSKGEVNLKDVIKLVHPKPQNEEKALLYRKVLEDKLEIPYTWETQLSEAGQKRISKKKVWEELIDSDKVGYMALLRNLRNILQAEVSDEHLKKVLERLSDEDNVRKSKQLPFRFLSAYLSLESLESFKTGSVLEVLEKAINASMDNLTFLHNKKIVIASDVSGSMLMNIGRKSKISYYDIGLTLSMLANAKLGDTITGIFGDIWKVKNFPKTSILSNVSELREIEGEVGYSTNGFEVLKWAVQNRIKTDMFIFFTDCQLWDSQVGYSHKTGTYKENNMSEWWDEYKKINPDASIYMFDLAGYGYSPLSIAEKNVYLISGWSEKIFDVLETVSSGEKVLEKVLSVAF